MRRECRVTPAEPLALPCNVHRELLLKKLREVVERTRCSCIALSGGIDTSVIAAVARGMGIGLRGYTVIYTEGVPRDLPYADRVARALGMELRVIRIGRGFVGEAIPVVRRCISVEPDYIELRNDVVFYAALLRAREDGCSCIYTGSGGDEIFAGYSFLLTLGSERLEELRARYAYCGRYPELEIARCLGVEVVAPYLSKEVLETALRIPITCLRTGVLRGKEILREILDDLGLHTIASRVKAPAESGAGTDVLIRL